MKIKPQSIVREPLIIIKSEENRAYVCKKCFENRKKDQNELTNSLQLTLQNWDCDDCAIKSLKHRFDELVGQ
jgi:hypothetical protein